MEKKKTGLIFAIIAVVVVIGVLAALNFGGVFRSKTEPEATPEPVVDEKPIVNETPAEPQPQPQHEERVIHNLFDTEETFEEPVDDEPLIVESTPTVAPEPERTTATPRSRCAILDGE